MVLRTVSYGHLNGQWSDANYLSCGSRTCERVSESGTSDKEDEREKSKWYGHVKRRDEGLRRMLDAPVPGLRRRGLQKTRWKDPCRR